MKHQLLKRCCLLFVPLSTINTIATAKASQSSRRRRTEQQFPFGHSGCPCVESDELDNSNATLVEEQNFVGIDTDISAYGIHCAPHDLNTDECSTPCKDQSDLFTPVAPDLCDKSYCRRSWCYVDRNNCDHLEKSPTILFNDDRYYSYATCGDVDTFTGKQRIASLYNRTMRVALLRNSGGWSGAYSSTGEHFKGPWSLWKGVAVDLIQQAAIEGRFNLNLTSFPDFSEQALESVGSANEFGQCAHAASLGFVDLCISNFIASTARALVVNFVPILSQPIYLLIDEQAQPTFTFWDNLGKVFAPFEGNTWLFMLVFVIPLLGLVTLFVEYGSETYPKTETIIKENEIIEEHPVPLWMNAINSFYIALVSILRGDFPDENTETIAGRVNVIGMLFFIGEFRFVIYFRNRSTSSPTLASVVIVATYTANLASFFTLQASQTRVRNIDDAIAAGYRLCISRIFLPNFQELYPQVSDSFFVVDPTELGGDGRPGFDCRECKATARVITQLDPIKAETDERYCHASVTSLAEMEMRQSEGKACGITPVGTPVLSQTIGFPVASSANEVMQSLFVKLTNEGLYRKLLETSRPTNRCRSEADRSELSRISVADLTGIWAVTFGFALLAVGVSLLERHQKRRAKRKAAAAVILSRADGDSDPLPDKPHLGHGNLVFDSNVRESMMIEESLTSFGVVDEVPHEDMEVQSGVKSTTAAAETKNDVERFLLQHQTSLLHRRKPGLLRPHSFAYGG